MACNKCTGTCSGACGQPKLPTGAKGVDGKNAYTYLAANFTMPSVGSNVTITVQNTGQFTNKWAGVGSIIFIETAGYFEVVSLTGTNQITIENLGYPSNAAPTTNILTGVLVQTSGERGEAGVGTAGVDGTTNLHTVVDIPKSATTGGFETLDTYALPANELAATGDALEIKVSCYLDLEASFISLLTPNVITVDFDGFSLIADGLFNSIPLLTNTTDVTIDFRLIRTGATTASCVVKVKSAFAGTDGQYYYKFTGLDFTQINPIRTRIAQANPSCIFVQAVTIDKIKAA
jgi:hypothetical protein